MKNPGYVAAIVCMLSLLVFSVVLADVSIEKELPSMTEGAEAKVTILVSSDSEKLDIAEFVPEGWQIVEWQASGADAAEFEIYESYNYLGKDYDLYHWRFADSPSEFSIEYTIVPEKAGEFKFVSLWLWPEGFDSSEQEVEVLKESKVLEGASGITGLLVLPDAVQPATGAKTLTIDTSGLSEAVNSIFSQKFY